MQTVGVTYAMHAILIDKYHLTPREIGRLTDLQIRKLYFHERTREGAIRIPMPEVPEAVTWPEIRQRLMDVAGMMEPAEHAKMMQEAEAKYGNGYQPAK